MAALAVSLGFAGSSLGQASFRPWGQLPGYNNWETRPLGVSADGTTAVGYVIYDQFGDALAVRWTQKEGLTAIDPPGETQSRAHGVSATGEFIVGTGNSGGYRWSSETGMVYLGGLPGYSGSQANAISADGTVVVGSADAGQTTQAVRWTQQDGLSSIGPGHAFGTSGDGSVIVGDGLGGAFRWTTDGGMELLGDLPGGDDSSYAWAVSGDGKVVVGSSHAADGSLAFRWTEEGGMESLGALPGSNYSRAWAASWDGSVIVGQSSTANGGEAFVWTEAEGMRSLRDILIAGGATGLDGWQLYEATGVSGDGTVVVGWSFYNNPCGGSVGWIADLASGHLGCYADCDANCSGKADLNLFDFLCFQNKFLAHEPYADCTGDGVFDLFDFLCFVNAFNQGC